MNTQPTIPPFVPAVETVLEMRTGNLHSTPCRQPTVSGAFTLVELLVSLACLVLIMVLVTQLFNSATIITTSGNNHMDADSQARAVFDRMALDFSQIVKRPDVDYFLKDSGPNNPETVSGTIPGNDQLAFYSQSPGYYSGTSAGVPCPVSLVAYRVNGNTASPYYNQLQRYGCGLFWSGMQSVSGSAMPVVFSGSSNTVLPNTISTSWPAATMQVTSGSYSAGTYEDTANNHVSNYEPIGPEVFRFEYYYVLKGQTATVNGTQTTLSSQLSDTPWDKRITGHMSANGLADVAAIGVVMAVINPKSRALVSNAQLANLAATLKDFPQTNSNGAFQAGTDTVNGVTIDLTQPGGLEYDWGLTINSTNLIPRLAASSIRIYKRYFYLSQSNTSGQ